MTSRPSGTVTFLFTDIEGSTRMWEEHPSAMPAALEQHDAILRKAIEEQDGYVFTTAGDAFAASFTDPSAALDAAVTSQRALAEVDWGALESVGVRMALHTGVAHEREGDYFGPALNRAARILAAGHGGQILLSLGTEELVGESLDGLTLRDLGEHTLKDLGRPERIYQVVHPELQDEFPGLLSLDTHPNNLPIQLTTFVGRDLELNDVVKRLNDSRLLTLTGVGGSGKTRLALQAAAEGADEYPNGVWLVELASIGDVDLVPSAIGDVLGLTRSQGGSGSSQLGGSATDVLDQVTDHLASRTCLLVLDNCEHLITATAKVVQHLLQHCSNLTVLATSREGLGIPGEVLWQVPSLAGAVEEDDPLKSDAVRLFVERAQDANPRFGTDAETLSWVQQVCERLDGMPLAIELAAARARVLDAKQIAERLDDRFRLLTGGSRTALPRHQTLEATVDWSYELMSENERAVFQRLAAFRGGFSLEAAEAVCAGGEVDSYDVLDLIGHLVDKSMVVRDEITGRFGMLETLRQYALRRLTESAEVDEVRVRHAVYFRDFAVETTPHLNGAREAEAYKKLSADHDNFRAAMAYGLENGHEETGAQIASRLAWYWWAASDTNAGLEWIRKALPHQDTLGSRTRAELLAFAALFAGFQRMDDADDFAGQAIALGAETANAYAEGLGHMARAYADFVRSEFDLAKEHALEMLKCGERAGDAWMIANAELLTGLLDRLMSRLDDASERLAAAEVAYRRSGQPSGLGWVLSVGGQIARYRGDFEAEIEKQREAREIFEEQGAPFQIAFTLINEGVALTLLHRAVDAIAPTRRAIAMEREMTLNDFPVESMALAGWFEHEAGNLIESLDLHEESVRACAPAYDRFRMELPARHLMILMSDLERWEDAARLDGFHLANQSRPEADVYTRHFQHYRDSYQVALDKRTANLVEEGRVMPAEPMYDFMLGAIREARELVSKN
ncbi:MAG: adenylate/guanylate cyclase domain-containing protein [Acidimicrobiia bacterium]